MRRRRCRTTILLVFASILVAAVAAPAVAQVEPETAADRQGVISYAPADFAAARPNTALDMVSWLPGFLLLSGDKVRGFAGAAGNILLDGQRPTIKTESLSDTLSRIPIDQVERIDLIRGCASGIDIAGSDGCGQRNPQARRHFPADDQRI